MHTINLKTTLMHSVAGSESGTHGYIKPYVILNVFQNIAEINVNDLNIGLPQLKEQGLSWFLLNYHIKINHYPRYGDNLEFQTWPCMTKGLKAIREFLVTNSHGEEAIVASSVWALIDMETKRPVKFDRISYDTYPKRVLESEFEKIPDITEVTDLKDFNVIYNEIDINQHVNNPVYLIWALEAVPYEILSNYNPTEIEMSFKSNVCYGDKISSICQIINNENELISLHTINQKTTDKELVRIRMKWSEVHET